MARPRASRASLSRHDAKPGPAATATTTTTTTTTTTPTAVSPPYWQHSRHSSRASVASLSSGRPAPITLEDNSGEGPAGAASPLWARRVAIDAHAVVSGNVRGVGDYVVWLCRVDMLDVRIPACARAKACC